MNCGRPEYQGVDRGMVSEPDMTPVAFQRIGDWTVMRQHGLFDSGMFRSCMRRMTSLFKLLDHIHHFCLRKSAGCFCTFGKGNETEADPIESAGALVQCTDMASFSDRRPRSRNIALRRNLPLPSQRYVLQCP
jgi:hypothetical protein